MRGALNTQIGPSLTGVPDDLIVSPGFEAPHKVEQEEVAVQTDEVYISYEPPAASPSPVEENISEPPKPSPSPIEEEGS